MAMHDLHPARVPGRHRQRHLPQVRALRAAVRLGRLHLDETRSARIPDHSKCAACHRCVTYCPAQAHHHQEERARLQRHPTAWSPALRQEHLAAGRDRRRACSPAWATTSPTCASSTTSARRLPGDQPVHRPAARADGAAHLPGPQARQRRGRVGRRGRLPPQAKAPASRNNVKLETPIMFAPMSYGSVSLNVHKSLAMAAERAAAPS